MWGRRVYSVFVHSFNYFCILYFQRECLSIHVGQAGVQCIHSCIYYCVFNVNVSASMLGRLAYSVFTVVFTIVFSAWMSQHPCGAGWCTLYSQLYLFLYFQRECLSIHVGQAGVQCTHSCIYFCIFSVNVSASMWGRRVYRWVTPAGSCIVWSMASSLTAGWRVIKQPDLKTPLAPSSAKQAQENTSPEPCLSI